MSDFNKRLKFLFSRYEPAQLKNIDKYLEKYKGKEEELIKSLEQKYEKARDEKNVDKDKIEIKKSEEISNKNEKIIINKSEKKEINIDKNRKHNIELIIVVFSILLISSYYLFFYNSGDSNSENGKNIHSDTLINKYVDSSKTKVDSLIIEDSLKINNSVDDSLLVKNDSSKVSSAELNVDSVNVEISNENYIEKKKVDEIQEPQTSESKEQIILKNENIIIEQLIPVTSIPSQKYYIIIKTTTSQKMASFYVKQARAKSFNANYYKDNNIPGLKGDLYIVFINPTDELDIAEKNLKAISLIYSNARLISK